MEKIFVKRGRKQVSEIDIQRVSDKHNISKTTALILLNRMNEDDIGLFLNSDLNKLHDPYLFKDMKKAVDRINRAFVNNEHIVIWGDFDCDGVCSTSILMLEMSMSTRELSYYIPNRKKEGYGVNKEGIKRLKEERNASLIITVDCGITSNEEVEYAKTLGIDMIITDHHRADRGVPDAYAVINPQVEGETYPFKELCGAGVASKLAQGLYGMESIFRTIDILSLATVADLVPLKGENRVIVKNGLRAINYYQRPAFQAMSKYALKEDGEVIKAHHFGFRYGPMVNASGRLGIASDAVRMFLTEDPREREDLALKLYEYNNSRKAIEQKILDEVEEKLKDKEIKNAIIIAGEGWEAGVVGIVASRIVEKYYKPTIILNYNPNTNNYKGSGRSIEGVDLFEILLANEDYLGKWGGHSEAAGLEVLGGQLENFENGVNAFIDKNYGKEVFIPKIRYDLEVDMKDIDEKLVSEIELLEPLGLGNPSVKLRCSNVSMENVYKMGKDKEHFSAQYTDGTNYIKGVSFFSEPPGTTESLDIIFKPNINEFAGRRDLQLMVEEIVETKKQEPINQPTKEKKDYNISIWDKRAPEVDSGYKNISFVSRMNPVPISDFIKSKTKVGQFKKANINNHIDLLSFRPNKFYDFTRETTVLDFIRSQKESDMVNMILYIEHMNVSGNHLFLRCVDMNKDRISVSMFNQAFHAKNIMPYSYISVQGDLRIDPRYGPQINPISFSHNINESKIIKPIYPKIKGMSDQYLTDSIKTALSMIENKDYLEEELLAKYNLQPQPTCFQYLHQPKTINDIKMAAQREIFDRLFQLSFRIKGLSQEVEENKIRITKRESADKLISELPFELTEDQDKTVNEIIEYMNKDQPLQGLVQGDVGSGKTIVSILTMLATIDNGYQATMIAPTEVLAKQHYNEVVELLDDYDINIKYLAGQMKAKEKREILKGIKDGSIDMVIGTHAVIQDGVDFKNLGLVVIDEQHRFGVEQRQKLRNRPNPPHTVLMSATPIPRTLSIALYGDGMKVFNIKSLPKGRLPIKTKITDDNEETYDFIYKEIKKGRQAYIVCPLINKSKSDKMKDVSSLDIEFANAKRFFAFDKDIRIEMISGDMDQADINDIISKFEKNEVHILLSTTIIEVGVNVPNASVIAIKSSNRFGLAQLHQLRGRVGRGSEQSYCILQPDGEDVKAEIIKSSTDGFKIAEEDLKLRGHGNMFGNEQSGESEEINLMLSFPDLYNKISEDVEKIYKDKDRFSNYKWMLKDKDD